MPPSVAERERGGRGGSEKVRHILTFGGFIWEIGGCENAMVQRSGKDVTSFDFFSNISSASGQLLSL
eukprot:784228-Amorphochlora_amoeboformis.AAC.2